MSIKYKRIADGIYRSSTSETLFERPYVNEKRTWRSLETSNLKLAKEELHRRRSGQHNYNPQPKSLVTVGEVIRLYQKDDYPDSQRQKRPERTHTLMERACRFALPYWDSIGVGFTSAECDRYHDWRVPQVKQSKAGNSGNRTVDLELSALSCAFDWACRCGLVKTNPLATKPRYTTENEIRHCRDTSCNDAEHLHQVARLFFSSVHPKRHVLGWQLLMEAMTGLRTIEVLRFRMDAQPYEPGWITPDGKSLCVGTVAGQGRAKKQHSVNPFVAIHDGLRAVLDAHRRWYNENHSGVLGTGIRTPWYFPRAGKPSACVGSTALAHALGKMKGKKVTSHGMRAFYVLVRRSNGISDVQIAYEIGHTTGGATIAAVYGGCPPNWLAGDGPKMGWLPAGEPAWRVFWEKDNIIQLPQAKVA